MGDAAPDELGDRKNVEYKKSDLQGLELKKFLLGDFQGTGKFCSN